jgi:hypothetical protein
MEIIKLEYRLKEATEAALKQQAKIELHDQAQQHDRNKIKDL